MDISKMDNTFEVVQSQYNIPVVEEKAYCNEWNYGTTPSDYLRQMLCFSRSCSGTKNDLAHVLQHKCGNIPLSLALHF